MKRITLILILAGAMAAQASAAAIPTAATIIEVTATSGGFSDTFSEVFPVDSQDGFSGVESYTLPAPVTLADNGEELGMLKDLTVTFNADPQIDLNFAVTNSNPTTPVMFSISTATILLNPAVQNAKGAAVASITATDGAADSDLAVAVTGLFADGKSYQARYSTDSVINTQTVFANLVPSQSYALLGGSTTEKIPFMMDFTDLGTTVHMMESQFMFGLSGGDQATGSSTFIIVPEPAALLLLAFGGLLIRRRMA